MSKPTRQPIDNLYDSVKQIVQTNLLRVCYASVTCTSTSGTTCRQPIDVLFNHMTNSIESVNLEWD